MKKQTQLVTLLSVGLLLHSFISYAQVSQNRSENFSDFIQKFSKDKVFQLSRVIFPLPCKYVEDENITYYTKSNWRHLKLMGEDEHTKRTIIEKDAAQIIVNYKGIDNGQDSHFYFKLIDNKWYLWKMDDDGV